MKLSVKWLAGLAVLVLAVVAVVGSTSATKAATGSIFVANEWSLVTNESPAPTGFTARSTVFGTYQDAPGDRIIRSDSDFIRVIVVDSEINQSVTTTANGTAEILVAAAFQGSSADSIAAAAGSTVLITLVGAGVSAPIAGTLAEVQANTSIVGATDGELVGDEVQITNFFSGSASGPPLLTLFVNVTLADQVITINYQTSTLGSVEIKVTSELQTTPVTVTANETSLGSGRFEGFVQLRNNTVTAASSTAPHGKAQAALIPTNVGPVTLAFTDSDSVNRETTVSIDTTAPVPSVTGPVDGSATQNLRPTFSGTVSETGAGLKVSELKVHFDDSDDALNGTPVISTTTAALGAGATDLGVVTTGALDGDTAFSFSKAPDGDIPGAVSGNPDHVVDWVIVATDLAGNIGLSDADTSTSGTQLPNVKIDKVVPAFTGTAADHKTGLADSATGEVVAKNSLRVALNDDVTNVQASDFTVTLDSGAVIVPTKVTVQNDLSGTFLKPLSTGSTGALSVVYLEFANDLVSSETPLVSLQDIISDLAGNFISQGDKAIGDGIAPTLTISLSGGSGTGQTLASEGPDGLTNDKITITIDSDEPLSGAPVIDVTRNSVSDTPAPVALAQGSNKWIATYSAPSSPTDGEREIEITATDVGSNSGTSDGPTFDLDSALAAPNLTVGGGSNTTDQTRPSIVIDYLAGGEASTVTLAKVELDGTDITADVVAASDGKRFFYIPPSDLALGDHELVIEAGDASDAADNDNATDTTLTITVEERSTFNLDVFAGWNALSFPSDPIDPDINSVFTNAGHDAVLGFDSSVPGLWRVSVRDTVSGLLEPATEGGLTSVRTTQAYWVHSNNFEQVKALLVGEVLPAAGSPPGIVTIQTVLGFNAVPVVDTSRKLTTGGSTALLRQAPGGGTTAATVENYLGSVAEGRVYRWDPEILSFIELPGTTAINTGEVLFVEVTGTPVPIFP